MYWVSALLVIRDVISNTPLANFAVITHYINALVFLDSVHQKIFLFSEKNGL